MPDDSRILEDNLAALAAQPAVLERVKCLDPYPDDAISIAKSGDPIITLAGPEGGERPLHSRYQPVSCSRRRTTP